LNSNKLQLQPKLKANFQIQIRFTFQYYTATEGYDLKHIYYGVRSIQVIGR